MGPQGAGKGTQAEILAKELNIPAISMGALLRDEIAGGSEKGLEAKSYIDGGTLVPDDLALSIIQERLTKSDAANGWILDGFPRILKQADLFLESVEPTHAILLEITDDQSVERLSGRVQCNKCRCGFQLKYVPPKENDKCDHCDGNLVRRSDDVPEVIRQRLEIYHTETEPVADKFEGMGILYRVDGSGNVEEVAEKVKKIFE
ncbi:MAG: Adenylate kinase [Candidatus Uhrbacteria bacterium GW2011_GWE2_45_35]|uniref:Adenylate kinase n=2 Tax=Candidatus Uhriibacteriota TaxID=1752732 RepID=A0A0G1JKV8_9BACT|nr:MAG: Adenylate kinase [Candidatus Uhrbacteria bacterium GW2011_GWF2_44_350]KKU09249.1 MAG: Adenylate kinase [Candidatus Uhrbacteria bacterium GW2011_GWE2_45_35]